MLRIYNEVIRCRKWGNVLVTHREWDKALVSEDLQESYPINVKSRDFRDF